MIALKYPKIETLYNRGTDFVIRTGELRQPEFELVNRWHIHEKINGMNIRVAQHADGSIEFGGRNDNASIPVRMVNYLRDAFTRPIMDMAFPEQAGKFSEIILFGEGYGAGIQKGGGYTTENCFRLFDVAVAGDTPGGWWWLNIPQVEDVAVHLGVETAPYIGVLRELPVCKQHLQEMIPHSIVAEIEGKTGFPAEGIVARTDPLLFDRRGNRVMWKLKFSDFLGGQR